MNTMPKLETIFAEAVELHDPVQQRDYIDSACQDNTLLRNRVGALIEANRRAASFMTEPAGIFDLEDFEATTNEPIGEQPGDVVGRYELVEQIGEGGMGTVFLARQTEPVKRNVALKVVKPGLDTKEVVARFESERQALALMDHPHIARAFDAGATPSGRPFFVMEHVQGQSISEYCNDQKLSTRERLELFIPVCEAIQHAHHKGIIHRDIKPHNVLVATANNRAIPKVIDFGIAKATDQRLTEKTLQTRLGQFIGTPAYMSPEQAGMTTVDIDTRSDVYSLGATLYELLTGVAPFDIEELKTKPSQEICRVIREETPVQPSAAISTNKDAKATAVARARRATPAELKSTISGDLDWIVMRALEKDRDRRYATAASLADDIQRYLRNEAIVARPPTIGYQVQKFIARNRLAVASALTVASTLILAACISAAFGVSAMRSRNVAEKQTKIAEREKASLLGVVQFMNNGLFDQANPLEEPNRNVTLRYVLDRAAQRLANKHSLRPDVEAAVRTTLGQTYRGLGEYRQSHTHLRRARDLYLEQHGPNDRKTATAENELAQTCLALAEFEEAKSSLDQAMWIAKHLDDTALRLETMQLLASYYESNGESQEAESLLTEVLKTHEAMAGRKDPKTYEAMANLAYVYQSQGRHNEALPLLTEAHDGLQTMDHWHPSTLQAAASLARLYTVQGNVDQAEKLYEKTIERLETLLGADNSQTMTAKHGLGLVYVSRKQFAEASRLLSEVLQSQREHLGSGHPSTLTTMHNLALLHARLGNTEEAKFLYEDELKGQRELHGPDHNATRETVSALAFFYMNQSNFSEAIPHYEALTNSLRKSPVVEHRAVMSQTMLGLCRHKTGEHAGAKEDLAAALADCMESFPNNWMRPVIEGQLGEVCMRLGQRDEAETALISSYEQLKEREADLPLRWRPLGLRAAARRLAEYYEASTNDQQKARARDYRAEYEHICKFGSIQNETNAGNTEDGDSN